MRQLIAIAKAVENGGNVTKAMREAGYSEGTINNPANLTKTDAWKDLVESKIPDDDLIDCLKEGLIAGRDIYKNNNETGEVEMVGHAPDYKARHKYLETGLKIKGRLKVEPAGLVAVQVNVGEDRMKYT